MRKQTGYWLLLLVAMTVTMTVTMTWVLLDDTPHLALAQEASPSESTPQSVASTSPDDNQNRPLASAGEHQPQQRPQTDSVQPLQPSTVSPRLSNASQQQTCSNYAQNGGFEGDTAWQTNDPSNARYDTTYVKSGSRSLALDVFNKSFADSWQRISIPANASSVTLYFSSRIGSGGIGENAWAAIYDAPSDTLIQEYWLEYPCTCQWYDFSPTFTVSSLAGRDIFLVFELDNGDSVKQANFDDVNLEVCVPTPPPTNTPTPTPIPPTPTATATPDRETLLKNGDFSQADQFWVSWGMNVQAGGNPPELCMHFDHATANLADAGISQAGLLIEQGARYQLSFTAWSKQATTLKPIISLNHEPWTNYWNQLLALPADAIKPYSFQFTMQAASDANSLLAFHAGAQSSEVICLQTVRLIKVAAAPPTATATATPAAIATATATATSTAIATATASPSATPIQPAVDPYEPNNACAEAKPIVTNGSVQSQRFTPATDVDWVSMNVNKDTPYRVEVQIPAGSKADMRIEIYPDCNSLSADPWDKNFTPGARFDFTSTVTGSVYLKLSQSGTPAEGADLSYQLTAQPLPTTQTGVLILVAGRLKYQDEVQPNIHHVTNAVYDLFSAKGYTRDRVQYLAADPSAANPNAKSLTRATLKAAITQWATSQLSGTQSLTLYMMDHGDPKLFYLDGANKETLKPSDLNDWLNELERQVPGVKINVILEACYAGSFITDVSRISKPGRVIITSTSDDNRAYVTSNQGAYFSDNFLNALKLNVSLDSSFRRAKRVVEEIAIFQRPWLDDNGDGKSDEKDGTTAAQRSFQNGSLASEELWEPYIADVKQPALLENRHAILQATVLDDLQQVEDVWAVVYAPSYRSPQNSNELTPEVLPTLKLLPQGNDRYATEYAGFEEAGIYRIVIHAKDKHGLEAQPVVVTVDVGSRVLLPLVRR